MRAGLEYQERTVFKFTSCGGRIACLGAATEWAGNLLTWGHQLPGLGLGGAPRCQGFKAAAAGWRRLHRSPLRGEWVVAQGRPLSSDPLLFKASPRQEARLEKPSQQRGTEKVHLGNLWQIPEVVESCRSDQLAGQTELLRAGRSHGFWSATSSLPSPASSGQREISSLVPALWLGGPAWLPQPPLDTLLGLGAQKSSSKKTHSQSLGLRVWHTAGAQ